VKQLLVIVGVEIILLVNMAQGGDLQLSESTIDYDTIKEGPPIVKRVVLTNGGTKTLTIANVTTS
jgi:hypothetical protein